MTNHYLSPADGHHLENTVWSGAGGFNPAAGIAAYAREHGLGPPLSGELINIPGITYQLVAGAKDGVLIYWHSDGTVTEGYPPFSVNPPFAGKGIWIWYLNQAEGGDLDRIAQRVRDNNLDWVAVKAGDGSSFWNQFQHALPLREMGVKLYSWTYHYGGMGEAAPVLNALSLGSDGHIFDVEAEFAAVEEPGAAAYQLIHNVITSFPEARLAFAPLPVIDNFPNLPYEEFNRPGLVALPQFYTKALGTGTDYPLARLIEIWRQWMERWSHKPLHIYPVLQAYGTQTPDNLREEAQVCMESYGGFSLWAWYTMTEDYWRVVREA